MALWCKKWCRNQCKNSVKNVPINFGVKCPLYRGHLYTKILHQWCNLHQPKFTPTETSFSLAGE